MSNEDMTPEEERARMLEIELKHIKRKYGDAPIAIGRMKYYPHHPEKNYDDENGNSYDYGFGDFDDEEDDEDNWWRK